MMKLSRNTLKFALPLLGAMALSSTSHAFDLGSILGGSDKDKASATAADVANQVSGAQTSAATTGSAMADGLVGMLGEQLGISQTQAIGGLGALVGYAGNNLPEEYATQLKSLLPDLSNSSGSGSSLTSSLMGNLKSMDSVKTAFSSMGMDPSMVDQFTPLIESYVGDNASNSEGLVNALSSLW